MSEETDFFQSIFHEKQIDSKNRLYDFLQDSGEEQIHDLRTSIRRLEATYSIFPKSCKGKKSNIFVSSYLLLFKKNSPVRDMDIIAKKLLNHGISPDSKIIQEINAKKGKKIKKTSKLAKKISEMQFSNLKKIDGQKITQNYDKKVLSLVTKIQDLIPLVVSDESNAKELHSMRKTAKKLRYVLEIEFDKPYRQVVDSMKSFQDILGFIHDCDVTINFLKKHSKKLPKLEPILAKEKTLRSGFYTRLTTSLSSTSN